MNALSSQRWAPHVTVATVVSRAGQLLLVEEEKHGRRVLNQPAGHLEPGESLVEAAVRETREETGWEVRPSAFIGAYQWDAPDGKPFLRFAFAAEPVRHYPDQPLDTGIVRALWLTPAALQADMARLRSPLVWQAVSDWLAGQRHPLSMLRQVP
ncbi:MAG: NUDIX hydrolase [Stenotrophomonas nitritireducens]|uniref:NUDIX hydrolase n=1 Tax=Stenotrophomonas TaxID=40323 RepID=UPI001AC564AD|nr:MULTISPECIES: NUDIX hydrolase [Stenotrophomonas]MBN8768953.1 NUDIX hydrolase [Stenotrophomonas sp.]MBN8792991.1 NUDIX hydrolase [Stenotrophomonas nitritireducens]